MTGPDTLWAGGTERLARDPAFADWVGRVGPVDLSVSTTPPFAYLVGAIVRQQLAGAAAAVIHGRVVDVLDGDIRPEPVLATDPADLRGAGLSKAKARAIQDLAARVVDGSVVLDERDLARLDDDAVVARLMLVWGVGRWTAEMFLMFRLGRPDVWPVGDLGVRAGWARIHRLSERPEPAALAQAADHLRPWRSATAWYCWRALELPGEEPTE